MTNEGLITTNMWKRHITPMSLPKEYKKHKNGSHFENKMAASLNVLLAI